MTREVLSTARPTKLRLAGFLCLAAGAVLAGVGATREWVAIGFPADREHAVDAPIHGTDVWEGKVILLGAGVALGALLAMRLARSGGTRRFLAVLLVVLGVACTAIPLLDAARARDRFGGNAAIDRHVAWLAGQSDLPEDVIREQFRREYELALRVDVRPGVWLAAAGGLLLVGGGVLSFAWVRRREASPTEGAPLADPG